MRFPEGAASQDHRVAQGTKPLRPYCAALFASIRSPTMPSRLLLAVCTCILRALVVAAACLGVVHAQHPPAPSDRSDSPGKSLPTATAAATGNRITPSSGQGRRVALVIGNGDYRYQDNLPRLANPVHDAEDIASALRRFGFEVIERKNQTLEAMHQSIAEFGSRIGGSEAALFFFAGHGIQVRNQNYLMPINAKVESEAMVPYQGVNVNQILDEMDNGRSSANIVILDACRNNPVTGKFRSGQTRGLASPGGVPKGTVIVYATDPGNVAADGDGRNGLLTAGLLAAFKGRDLSLDGVLTVASAEVERASAQAQTPYVNGPKTLQKNFHFRVTVDPGRSEVERTFWTSIERSTDAADFEAYLKNYPQGSYRDLAENQLRRLRTKPVEATRTPATAVVAAVTAANERKGAGQNNNEGRQTGTAQLPARVEKPALQIGDRWVYRRIDLWKNEESARFEWRVSGTDGDSITLDRAMLAGKVSADARPASSRRVDRSTWTFADASVSQGRRVTFAFPLEIGKTWEFEYAGKRDNGTRVTHQRVARVEAWEDVEVPAGKFKALKVARLLLCTSRSKRHEPRSQIHLLLLRRRLRTADRNRRRQDRRRARRPRASGQPRPPVHQGRHAAPDGAPGLSPAASRTASATRLPRQRVGWDEALDHAADRFAAIIAAHGPDSVAFYISGQLLTEDYYVFNKLAKG
jgi:hypothetical protein